MSFSEPQRPPNREAFEVAIICALQEESDAVEASFDQNWENGDDDFDYGKAPNDPNEYSTGRIGRHNVVLAYMPEMGVKNATRVATAFRASFPNIRLGLVVGVCGVIPKSFGEHKEIFLGDVVVSTQVIQTDFGRLYDDGIQRKDTLEGNLPGPGPEIRAFLKKLRGYDGRQGLQSRFINNLDILCKKKVFRNKKTSRPRPETDRLYNPTYRHKHQAPTDCQICAACINSELPVCQEALKSSCEGVGCAEEELIPMSERIHSHTNENDDDRDSNKDNDDSDEEPMARLDHPLIHFGPIASSSQVVKSAMHRDAIAEREKVLAFEMEGAGVWETFPTIVVKAGCDYADSHKYKVWRNYAALAAAACAKAILSRWRGLDRRTSSMPQDLSRINSGASSGSGPNFFNWGGVQHQVGHQTVQGDLNFGPVQRIESNSSNGTGWGIQVGFNRDRVNDNHPFIVRDADRRLVRDTYTVSEPNDDSDDHNMSQDGYGVAAETRGVQHNL